MFGTDDEVTHVSTGVFSIELDFPDRGAYAVGAQGTGAAAAYAETLVEVTAARTRG